MAPGMNSSWVPGAQEIPSQPGPPTSIASVGRRWATSLRSAGAPASVTMRARASKSTCGPIPLVLRSHVSRCASKTDRSRVERVLSAEASPPARAVQNWSRARVSGP